MSMTDIEAKAHFLRVIYLRLVKSKSLQMLRSHMPHMPQRKGIKTVTGKVAILAPASRFAMLKWRYWLFGPTLPFVLLVATVSLATWQAP